MLFRSRGLPDRRNRGDAASRSSVSSAGIEPEERAGPVTGGTRSQVQKGVPRAGSPARGGKKGSGSSTLVSRWKAPGWRPCVGAKATADGRKPRSLETMAGMTHPRGSSSGDEGVGADRYSGARPSDGRGGSSTKTSGARTNLTSGRIAPPVRSGSSGNRRHARGTPAWAGGSRGFGNGPPHCSRGVHRASLLFTGRRGWENGTREDRGTRVCSWVGDTAASFRSHPSRR